LKSLFFGAACENADADAVADAADAAADADAERKKKKPRRGSSGPYTHTQSLSFPQGNSSKHTFTSFVSPRPPLSARSPNIIDQVLNNRLFSFVVDRKSQGAAAQPEEDCRGGGGRTRREDQEEGGRQQGGGGKEREMDFEGQRRAEQHLLRALLFFGLVGFLAGYVTSSFRLMVYVSAAGLAFSLLMVVPDWGWYNRHPTPWLPALSSSGHAAAASSSGISGDSSAGGKPAATTTTTTTTTTSTPRTAAKKTT
jgi:signal peptidase complex subunit 1